VSLWVTSRRLTRSLTAIAVCGEKKRHWCYSDFKSPDFTQQL